jgi:drug/metabolite transporter (DMT)-like permease
MQTHKTSGIVLGSLAALGCEALYGLSYIFTKQATNAASPIALLGWRFLIAFVVMSVLILLHVSQSRFQRQKVAPLVAGCHF